VQQQTQQQQWKLSATKLTLNIMANIYWSPATGNDSTGNGSKATPYKTVRQCYSVCNDNDHIILPAGVHLLTGDVIDAINTGTARTNITVRGETENARDSVIDGDNSQYQWVPQIGRTGITMWKDFTIRRNRTQWYRFYQGVIGIVMTVQNVWFDRNDPPPAYSGLFTFHPSDIVLNINRCVFNDYSSNNAIHANYITACGGPRITITATNNVFYSEKFKSTRYYFMGNGTNTVGSSTIIKNNIFVHRYPATVAGLIANWSANYIEWVAHNNVQHGALTWNMVEGSASHSEDFINNITADPKFVDEKLGYFNLQKDSPAINI